MLMWAFAQRCKSLYLATIEKKLGFCILKIISCYVNADLRKDSHRQDYYAGGRIQRHRRGRKKQDSGQGGYPPRPATAHLCWQATRGRAHDERLQHTKGVDNPPGAAAPRGARVPRRPTVAAAPAPPCARRDGAGARRDAAAQAPAAAHECRGLRTRAAPRAHALRPCAGVHRAALHAQQHGSHQYCCR